MTCNACHVKDGPVCPPECAENLGESTLREFMHLVSIVCYGCYSATNDLAVCKITNSLQCAKRRLMSLVMQNRENEAIALYHQIKGAMK